MRKRIYIAGPMTKGDRIANLQQALHAYRALIEKGFAPLCPQLTTFVEGMLPQFTHDEWLAIDLSWVAVADALIRLPGESTGADAEVAQAKRCCVPVYHNLGRLLEEMSA